MMMICTSTPTVIAQPRAEADYARGRRAKVGRIAEPGFKKADLSISRNKPLSGCQAPGPQMRLAATGPELNAATSAPDVLSAISAAGIDLTKIGGPLISAFFGITAAVAGYTELRTKVSNLEASFEKLDKKLDANFERTNATLLNIQLDMARMQGPTYPKILQQPVEAISSKDKSDD